MSDQSTKPNMATHWVSEGARPANLFAWSLLAAVLALMLLPIMAGTASPAYADAASLQAASAEQTVTSIEVKLAGDRQIWVPYEYDNFDEGNGEVRKDADGSQYYHYYLHDIYNGFPSSGDSIIVTYSDGLAATYTYEYVESLSQYMFKAKEGDPQYLEGVEVSDNQLEQHWGIGKNEFFVSYAGKSCSVPIYVKRWIGFADVRYKKTGSDEYRWFTWTGRPFKPAVTATLGGKKLKQGRDFSVSYVDNVSISGGGRVVVQGTGDCFFGTLPNDEFESAYPGLTFGIRPKGTTLSNLKGAKKSLTAQWKRQIRKMPKKRITGYQVQISKKANFKGARIATVKGYAKTSKKFTGLSANKKYYVRVRTYFVAQHGGAWKETVYSKWSKAKVATTRS